uniref:Cadherin 6 n=1 Tax=Xiphophorus couchianus TaxID=32473 RepID=A0A3B5MLU3_9TELE
MDRRRLCALMMLWAVVLQPGQLSCPGCSLRALRRTTGGRRGLTGQDANGVPLRRSKRGWMWNQFFLLEEYTGTDMQYVGKLHSDGDRGDGSVRYVLTGEGAGTLFKIDEKSGDIHATKRLDREEKAYYILHAKAVNRLTNEALEGESEFIIKIHDINDNEPRFTKDPYIARVAEMSDVGTSVIQVTATDADDATYGNSAKVVYSILEGQPYFSVDPETGQRRLQRSNFNAFHFSLTQRNQPGFPRNPPASPPLKLPPPGGAGRGGEGRRDLLQISRPKDLLLIITPLDYEKKRQYSLRIQVENAIINPRFYSMGPFRDEASVKVVVEDVDEPPVFERPSYIMEVREDAARNAIIGSVSASDPDDKHSLVRYTIDRRTDMDRVFNVHAGNGSVFILRELDREGNAWHNISIIATEFNNPRQISRVPVYIRVLDVNDNAPTFATNYETFVCENAKANQRIQIVSATDPDEPLGGHRFIFSLAPEAVGKANFSVRDNKDNTAWILTRRNSYNSLQKSVYHVPVVITDGEFPVQSSTNTLTIRVCTCDREGNMKLCNPEALTARAGLSTGALVAILLCVVILLMIVVLFAALRRQRKKEPLIISKEDVRDNVVSYNDEGGGEEDTQAFDIGTLRNPEAIEESKQRRDIIPETFYPPVRRPVAPPPPSRDNNGDVRDFINQRLQDNDSDPTAPPYDSLATYAYEGNGSVAESLSSLESVTTEGDQDYNYLSEWGPRFKKLADMYGGDDSDS